MKDRAYAKINLALDVFNVRENGYHDIKSVMVPINFYDELEIRINDTNEYICNKSFIKFDECNSILKMIDVVKEKYGINDNYYINLNKVVPTQAGIGGDTADAASTLRILKRMYKLNLTKEEEKDICVKVGADVLFNYYNKPALVSGIGDIVEPFELKKEYAVLLVKPRYGVSTKEAYDTLNMNTCDHPDVDKLRMALINGDDIKGLLGNSLQEPACILNTSINRIRNKLLDLGASNVLMSGSGSTVFAISENFEEIEKLTEIMRNEPYYIRLTKTNN